MGRSNRKRAVGQILRPTPNELVNGWGGPEGITLRLVRPGDLERVAELADSAGGPFEDDMRAGITDGDTATALVRCLHTGNKTPLTQQVAKVLAGAGTQPFIGLSMVLVAVRFNEVVGALYSLPPLGYITQLVNAGIPPASAMAVAPAVAKIRALAVAPEARGLGIATHLLQAAVSIYDRIGLYLIYGIFDIGSGLEAFYAARGFQIVPLGERTDMAAIVGWPVTLEPGPGEQAVTRCR